MADRPADVTVDVAVIGAGIVGLGIAWQVCRSGRTVAVIDPAPATGATYAAAGMLAPISELHYEEEDLLELTLASAALYPGFIAELGPATGYRTTSTLTVASDAADRRALDDLRLLQQANGLGVLPLTIRSAREAEPLLSASISAAFSVPNDHQVDPRLLAERLRAALETAGTGMIAQSATEVLHEDPRDAGSPTTGVALSRGGVVRAAEVIVANGLGALHLAGLPVALPLRPVFGDILRLRVPDHLRPLLTCTIRGLVRGLPVYLVPRTDDTVVIGATSREDGRPGVSAGGVHRLLHDAQVLVPAVAELELIEVTARARPGTPDNAPLIGRVAPGLLIATGFFRHGVLLTPIAARICVELLDGAPDPRWKRFHPDRFRAPAPQEVSHA
ncbi:glycine oxidase [Cryobacterium roopkundense]|uniref:glycine oxidase n=1 Tax=Cryobacterium roopkundense TaxID=1001240 RepID=A0A099JJ46_9MICO|nr:glycine oxidase ThiO [Cryobacterium roopkundense]KGJ77508.1 glycine oxidase [Cryobacterium roopkundense]MBB5642568.1 glycine oxidase [Cryobacterium roopkundense]